MVAAETVLQFGAGRFLRGFVDRFIQNANDAGQNVGQVVVVQSTPGARAALLNEHPDGYRVRRISDQVVLPAGHGVSYGAEYVTPTEETLAVVAAGYADGFRRVPKNVNEVLLSGQRGNKETREERPGENCSWGPA